jgi:hypothetical protein
LLQDVGSSFVELNADDKRDHFCRFLNIVIGACVEGGFKQHLKTADTWAQGMSIKDEYAKMKLNHPAMIRACDREDYYMVKTMYILKFILESKIADNDNDEYNPKYEVFIRELALLETYACPIYLLALHSEARAIRLTDGYA